MFQVRIYSVYALLYNLRDRQYIVHEVKAYRTVIYAMNSKHTNLVFQQKTWTYKTITKRILANET